MLTFYLLLLSPAHRSAGAVIYSIFSFRMTVLQFSCAGMEAFCNFVVREIVGMLIIRASALLYYLLITFTLLQYPLWFRVLFR